MNKKQKSAFEIKLKKETRKEILKTICPVYICLWVIMLLIFILAGKETGLGIIGWMESQISLSIIVICLMIVIFPFLYFIEKSIASGVAYKKQLKEISRNLVEKMMVKGKPVKIALIKVKGDFGDFVLELQKDEKIELYAVLGEKDNLISIDAVFKGEDKNRKLDVVTKEEFADFYRILDET